MNGALDAFRGLRDRAGVFLDFDGSLSAIVARPELAAPHPGAREALAALVGRYAVVAVVSGRRSEDVAELLGVEGVRYEGLYGLQGELDEAAHALAPEVIAAAAAVPQAWVEEKGISLAVHYRQAPEPPRARSTLVAALEPLAATAGLELVEGKMVLELVPAGRPMKGGTVERVAAELNLAAALFAGDDVADIDAFRALERLAARGLVAVRVAVRGDETPDALLATADVVVDGPAGLVELLGELA